LDEVSKKLRIQVYQDFYGKVISQIPFFTQNFSNEFLQELTTGMKE
jgi:hypothetical protein